MAIKSILHMYFRFYCYFLNRHLLVNNRTAQTCSEQKNLFKKKTLVKKTMRKKLV